MTSISTRPVEIDNLSFGYPGGSLVLDNVSLKVEEHEFVGIIGPNGGGKSTLLKLMLGILDPQSGSIRLFGQSPKESRKRIGYVPQYSTFVRNFPISVVDTVALGLVGNGSMFGGIRRHEREIARQTLSRLGVEHLSSRNISSLSGGQLQRVLIARALISKPSLLLLDEPTASVDPHGEEDIFKILVSLKEKLTIIVVSHDVGFVSSYVTKIACVHKNIVIHKPSEISAETLSRLYGGHVHAVVHDHHEHQT
jgi:zinc transport system ATP-binding protein